MDLDNLFHRYFGTSETSDFSQSAWEAGLERIRVDFGLETYRGRRFALWALLFLFRADPELDVAFKEESDREAARNFMDLLAASDAA
jgi:hypothetical protein